MRKMAIINALLILSAATAAAGVAVGPFPTPEFADTEVSTNFVFSVGEGLNRSLVFTVELQAVRGAIVRKTDRGMSSEL